MEKLPAPIRRVFFNDEPRLRAGWRILGFVVFYLVLGFVALLAIAGFIPPGEPAEPGLLRFLLTGVADFIAVVLASFLARGLFDKRRFETLGLIPRAPWLIDLAAGTALGLLLMTIIFAVHLGAGWVVVDRLGWQGPSVGSFAGMFLVMIVIFALVGFKEELMMRGYLLQNVEDGLGTVWAVTLTSIVFGALHLANPDSSVVAAAGITIAGVLFAVCYLVTRALWMPIGLHFAWNLAEGPIFGFPVSGIGADTLIVQHSIGPALLTGGSFGPEAGLFVLIATLLGIGLTILYGRWRTPRYGKVRSGPGDAAS